jgi:hypothetical protein
VRGVGCVISRAKRLRGFCANRLSLQIDYFNKRRILEERQKLMYEHAEAENIKRQQAQR